MAKKTETAKKPKPNEDPTPKLIARVEMEGTTYEIDIFDLHNSEMIALEEHMAMPYRRILADDWLLESVKVATFLAYLARKRRDPRFTLERLNDLYDLDEVNVSVRTDEEDSGSERPTETPPTDGNQSSE